MSTTRKLSELARTLADEGFKISGDWDMTPQIDAAQPDAATAVGGGVEIIDDANQVFTFDGQVEPVGGMYHAGVASRPLAELDGSARIRFPSVDTDDNVTGFSFALMPTDKNFEEFFNSINQPEQGDYGGVFNLTSDGGTIESKMLEDGVSTQGQAPVSITPDMEVYFIVDTTAGEIIAQLSGGQETIISGLNFDAWPGEFVLRLVLLFGSTPATFAAETLNFDMGNTAEGLNAFQDQQDPPLPEGLDEVGLFHVTATGPFKGKTGRGGDVALITNAGDTVRFIRDADPVRLQQEFQGIVDRRTSALEELKRNKRLVTVTPQNRASESNDNTENAPVGTGVIVGDVPDNEFENFTPGNIAYKTQDGWAEFDIQHEDNETHRGGWVVSDTYSVTVGLDTETETHGSISMLNYVRDMSEIPADVYWDRSTPTNLTGLGWVVVFNSNGRRSFYYPEIVEETSADASITIDVNTSSEAHMVDLTGEVSEQTIYLQTNAVSTNYLSAPLIVLRNVAGTNKVLTLVVDGPSTHSRNQYTISLHSHETYLARLVTSRIEDDVPEPDKTYLIPITETPPLLDAVEMVEGGSHTVADGSNVVFQSAGASLNEYTVTIPQILPYNNRCVLYFEEDVANLILATQTVETVKNPPTYVKAGDIVELFHDGLRWFNVSKTPNRTRSVIETDSTEVSLDVSFAEAIVKHTNTGAASVEVPEHAVTPIPVGVRIAGVQTTVDEVSFEAATTGITIHALGGATKTSGEGARYVLEKIGTDEWVLSGDITV